ncbi:MAG: hypothetical protein KC464_31790, partial [Myxococcales bacterium]|nr:hypothetical protein [Myxococcales bacterium]
EGPAVEPTEAAGPGESKEDCGAGDDVAPTPAMMAHLVAIRGHLDEDEIEFLTQVYAELTPPEVARWLRELSAMSVDEAVAYIRDQIEGASGAGAGGDALPEAAS